MRQKILGEVKMGVHMKNKEINKTTIYLILKRLALDVGQALVINYKGNYKLIIRKENGNKFVLVNPVDLEKYIFNLQATAILLMHLQGNEDMEIVENVKILNKNVSDEIVLEFIADLKSKF